MTLNSTSNTQQLELESTTTYESLSPLNPNQDKIGPKYIDPAHHGAINELHVATEAMKRGAKVFRNIAPSGNTDIILLKDESLLRVDVKHMKKRSGYNTYTSNHNSKPPFNVAYAYVNPETWKIRWNQRHIPKGWEDFWE